MTDTHSTSLEDLSGAGVSIWLDDLSRDRLTSGNLQRLIDERSVVGVTTNPSIFAAALSDGGAYRAQLSGLGDVEVGEAIRVLTTTDVRDACDLFAGIHRDTDGVDGRVSIEVEPELARDTDATVEQAALLHAVVGRDNVLIKIPGTREGLPAIRRTLAAGISVNVTLIFSVDRYREVMDAWMSGLEDAAAAGRDISTIHSVASFFVSRVDSEVDKRLEAIGSPEALGMRGRAGIANSRVAYSAWLDAIATDRWKALEKQGARAQRPLWASTSVKNPEYDDTMYVTHLVAPHCVNTMPEGTLNAVADHGVISGDTITSNIDDAVHVLAGLRDVGVDMGDVVVKLEDEGVEKFVASWHELESRVSNALAQR